MNSTERSSEDHPERTRVPVEAKDVALARNSNIARLASAITPARIRAHALILALCLWGVCAVDFATSGLIDRSGNLKFQDFLPIYISARMITQHRAAGLYDPVIVAREVQAIAARPGLRLPFLYGPQVGLCFVPLAKLPFLAGAEIWAALSVLLYFISIYTCWKVCPTLRTHLGIVILCSIAYPPLYHFFVRGQLSVLLLVCCTAAFLAFRTDRPMLAGAFLGLLIFKPQFLVAIPLILLFARAWKVLAGLALTAAAQMTFAWFYFGSEVMHRYLRMLSSAPQWIHTAELSLAPLQMHSFRSFWTLLLPWPDAAWISYILSSIMAVAVAASIWKSQASIELRFSALILAAVLVNPHLFIYDLLVLAPVLLLLADWSAQNPDCPYASSLRILLYLAFLLPLFGPLARWTHLQVSVVVFAILLWTLRRAAVRLEPAA